MVAPHIPPVTVGSGRALGPVVKATDPLPTADTVALAKGLAARACAEKAADIAWPDLGRAATMIELIPYVALAALIDACPEVTPARLASCLGLHPTGATAHLTIRRGRGDWPREAVSVVARQIAGIFASPAVVVGPAGPPDPTRGGLASPAVVGPAGPPDPTRAVLASPAVVADAPDPTRVAS